MIAENPTAMLVSYDELHARLRDVLVREGMERDRADHCARLFADSSRDGVASHGVNRFPRFIAMIRNGMVDVQALRLPGPRRPSHRSSAPRVLARTGRA